MNLFERIKKIENLIKNESRIEFRQKKIDSEIINDLKSKGAPDDIILILNELGEFTLAANDWHLFSVSKPSTLIETYEKGDTFYIDCLGPDYAAENLLFFLETGRAELFFYDTNFNPWKIYCFDGLSLWDHYENVHDFLKPENQMVKENYYNDWDVLRIIESELHM